MCRGLLSKTDFLINNDIWAKGNNHMACGIQSYDLCRRVNNPVNNLCMLHVEGWERGIEEV